MSDTKILSCGCKHPYQDATYGHAKRVHNHAPKRDVWRCTVCKAEKGKTADRA